MSKLKKQDYIARYGEEAWKVEVKKRSNANKQWRLKNKDWCNKEKKAEYQKVYKQKYKQTKSGRAGILAYHYKCKDKKYNRGNSTITREWIMDKIFTSSCIYCGETDWTKLGCDRIDNTKPHTPDNCVCACKTCNSERQKSAFEDFMNKKKSA